MSSQNYWNKVNRYIIGSGIILALVGAGFFFGPKVNQFQDYQIRKSDLEQKIHDEQEHIIQSRLNQEKFRTDKNFVQKIAHETGFAHEDEVIYQFEETPSTNGGPAKTGP